METIQKISLEKNNRYKIWLASGKSFLASEDALVSYRLSKGMEISSEVIAGAKKASQLDHGYQMALNYLSYQLRSQKEIEDYLDGKEIERGSINDIVIRLKGLMLIDDVVYGESYVRTQMRLSDKGPRVIRQQLKKRGLKEEVIDIAMDQYLDEEQLRVALEAGTKAERKYSKHSHYEKGQKIRQYLMTKGFSGEVITMTLEALALEKDDEVEEDLVAIQGDKLWRKNQRFDLKKKKQKVTTSLYQKGFSFDLINEYISQKELEDE
ncbi:recombination regulator RecX [Vagococcus salmoninarum]|uniref:Regulatory protein RecX n=1 Tax=Vagococcus salmoninarum TaxID=2739 RepID=A0A429ZLC7_9ENTE|nr:recombination regulator RecX [Vagococcus salmoninarum]RST94491.1 recombination regulator RecX [Vagococcus salmoninarum]